MSYQHLPIPKPALVENPLPSNPSRRKVLIIEDEPSIRNVLYVLLAGLGCDGDVAHDTQKALAMIRKDRFDAVLLDLRAAHLPPEEMVSAITELRPSLLGRVLVITGELSDPNTLEMLERCAVPHVPRSRVARDLWGHMRTLLGHSF
jgi:DNA-binding response OmpR family regulator